MKSTLKRKILSAAIAVTIVFQTVNPVIFATDNLPTESDKETVRDATQETTNMGKTCPHHVHDENCGFSPDTPCSHLHDDSCYQEITKCLHQHTEVCYPALDSESLTDNNPPDPTECTHICEEENGCLTPELSCQHLHDAVCGYAEGSACSFDPRNCDICTPTPQIGESDMSESFVQSEIVNLAETGEVEVYGILTSTGLFKANSDGGATTDSIDKKTITHLFVDSSVTSIGNQAFLDCVKLKTVELVGEPSLTKIEYRAFWACSNLKTFDLSKATKLTTIDTDAFNGCMALTSLIIPSSLTSIGSGAYIYCVSLETIDFSNATSLTTIGYDSFHWCRNLSTVDLTGAKKLESLANRAFAGCENLNSITFPDSAVSLGESVFGACENLETVNLNGVTSIGNETFERCSSLTTITIPSGVTSIGTNIFDNCSKLVSINVDDDNAFFSGTDGVLFDKNKQTIVSYLQAKTDATYTIPSSVISIGDKAFARCTNLTSIIIPDSVTSIGETAFSDCTNLTSIIIPDSVISIGKMAFSGCTSLTSIIIPDSVTSIGYSTFGYCESLTSITIPNSVISIGYRVFEYCESLTSITIPSSVTSIGYSAFEHCESLTSITIPSSVTSIGDEAFSYCKSLTSITLPNSVTSIGYRAFFACTNLTSITLPNSVTSIEDMAFLGCTNLKTVNFKGDTPPTIGHGAFYSCDTNLKIYVPNSKVSDYENVLLDYIDKIVKYKAETEFAGGVKTYKDDDLKTEFTYGETITVKVTPKQTLIQQQALRMTPPTTDQIALFIDDKQITEAKDMISDREETFTIDTASKIIPVNLETTITAKYVGNIDMADAEASVTITLKPKELTATVKEGATATKVYDGTSNFNNVKLTLVDVESDDTVTAIADGNSADADAGTKTFTATNVTLDGADKDWYSLAPTSVSGNVSITKADTDSENGVAIGKTALSYGDTLTVEYTPKSAPMAKASVVDTAQLYYGTIPLSDVTNFNNGKYTMTYNTNRKDIPISTNISSGESGLHIKFGGNSNLNEQIILVKGVSLSKRALTGTLVGNVNKNYDGTNDFTNIPLTLNGVENGDTVTASANGKSDNANAGTKAFTATSVTLSGEDKAWYRLATTSVRGQVTINKVAYNGTTSVTARVYESGQVGATVTLPDLPSGAKYGKPSASGAIIMTNMSVTGTTLTYTAPASKVGQTGIMTIPATGATNYKDFNIIMTVTSIANVKKQQDISYAAAEVTKIYGDEKFTNPLTEITVNGSIAYESNDTNIATVDSATGEVTIVGAGTATITATASKTSTHTQATASYSVTIGKKALTLRAEDKSMVKGEAMPGFTYAAIGLVNGDIITTPPTMMTTADGNKAGTFDISIIGGTIENNSSYEITYIKGTLTVAEKFYPVTVIDGTSHKEQASEGETVMITAGDRSGYTFKDWSSADVSFTNSTAKTTTFIMPAKAVTVTANYSKNGDSSSGGNNSGDGGSSIDGNNSDSDGNSGRDDSSSSGGTTTPTTPTVTEDLPPVTVDITTEKPTISEDTINIDLSVKEIQNALTKGQIEAKKNGKSKNEIVVVVKTKMIPTTANNLTIHLPKKLIDILIKAKVKEFRIENKITNISLNLDILKEMKKQIGTDIDIIAKKIDNKTLSQKTKNIIGTRPVYEFGITGTNGKKLTNFGAGRVSIAIPYILRKDEKAVNLHAYHIDSQDKITKIPNSSYDTVSKRLHFTTNHFSMFAVGYK